MAATGAAKSVAEEPPSAEQIHSATAVRDVAALARYRELLEYPNDALHPADLEVLLGWIRQEFESLGFSASRLESETLPLLLLERRAEGDRPTVLVYLQADGQPVDPARWDQESPWEPVVKAFVDGEWVTRQWEEAIDECPPDGQDGPDVRVFARSASDSKGPIAQLLAALHVLEGEGWTQAYHLKIVVDPEEELGSPRLPAVVERERARLSADRFVIFDGPPHPSGEPTLVFGARGIATVTLTTYGPRKPQHSGHYGNYVPNPALQLAQLLASMKDGEGRVTIPGYYDQVSLTDTDRAALASVPEDTDALHHNLGIGTPDAVAPTLQEAIQYPSLNIRGLQSGWVGEQARTIIPATATAEIDVRLVLESDAEALLAKIRGHIEEQGFRLIEGEPTEEERSGARPLVRWQSEVSYGAFRTPLDSPMAEWLERALTRYHGEPPILLRTLGGSIPIAPFVATLGLPAATVPTVNPDNNQHSPNENLRLADFFGGIGVMVSVLTEPF